MTGRCTKQRLEVDGGGQQCGGSCASRARTGARFPVPRIQVTYRRFWWGVPSGLVEVKKIGDRKPKYPAGIRTEYGSFILSDQFSF